MQVKKYDIFISTHLRSGSVKMKKDMICFTPQPMFFTRHLFLLKLI